MKMKKNEDVSDVDIDKVLIEKYDLGFLLDQIKTKKTRGFYLLSVVDVLRFFPQFNEATKQIRNELQIDPQSIQNKLGILIGRDKFQNYLIELKRIARAIDFPLNKESKIIFDQIEDWKRKEFPSLPKKVADIRLEILGKVPHTWQEAIEDYILFEKISPVPIIYRRHGADMSVKQDDKTREHYIEIKIYADTDIRYLPKISQWKKIQKSLPGYCYPTKWDEDLEITRFMIYVLIRHLKLTQKETLEWLEKHNLITPDYQHVSQELKRYEEHFLSTHHK